MSVLPSKASGITTSASVCGPLSLSCGPQTASFFSTLARMAATVSDAAITRACGNPLDRSQAEVVVGVALADVNGGESLARGSDCLREGAAVGQREAAVDQQGFGSTGDEHRRTEEAVRPRGKMFPCQVRCGSSGGDRRFHTLSPCERLEPQARHAAHRPSHCGHERSDGPNPASGATTRPIVRTFSGASRHDPRRVAW